MATVVHDASSSTVSENFPPAVLVIFRKSRGLRDNGTETGTPGTKFPSTDFFLSIIERVRDGTGGGCRLRSIFSIFATFLSLCDVSVYFEVFTLWPHSRVAAWPQKKMSTYPCGNVAAVRNL